MANTVFANKVIEAKLKDLLTTAVNTRSLMTVDTTLTESAGMTKTVNTYTYSGEAEEVAQGVANSDEKRGAISFSGKDYTVKTVQHTFDYYDEEFLKDPTIVDKMLKGATQIMTNKMTADYIKEISAANLSANFATALSYDSIVDAISELNVEDESGIFNLIPNKWKAALRKDDDYKAARMGEVIYNGQVGAICGLPVICSKALTDAAYTATKEAVTLFLKKDVEVEQTRDIEYRKNTVVVRAFYICALTDATKVCKITKGAAAG